MTTIIDEYKGCGFFSGQSLIWCSKPNFATQKAQGFLRGYKRSKCESLYDVYKSPSENKLHAERAIMRNIREFGGYGYRITGANCSIFTAMWKLSAADKGGIQHEYLIVETANNRYAICLRDC